mmetsp:Transcript_20282/g.61787  ORF Transcript_20282/g.61787 Transcript_20282/m.61787 type:complete len:218 (-) Transcript_20282:55-708(-)
MSGPSKPLATRKEMQIVIISRLPSIDMCLLRACRACQQESLTSRSSSCGVKPYSMSWSPLRSGGDITACRRREVERCVQSSKRRRYPSHVSAPSPFVDRLIHCTHSAASVGQTALHKQTRFCICRRCWRRCASSAERAVAAMSSCCSTSCCVHCSRAETALRDHPSSSKPSKWRACQMPCSTCCCASRRARMSGIVRADICLRRFASSAEAAAASAS